MHAERELQQESHVGFIIGGENAHSREGAR
jgi:hypothetical protein